MRCLRRIVGRFSCLGLVLVLPPESLAQEQGPQELGAILRLAQAEHWMVRISTTQDDTIVGRIGRATSTSVRFLSPDTSLALADVVRVEHGLRDESDARAGTGLTVIGAMLAGAGLLIVGDESSLLIVAAAGVGAIAGLVWYATTHAAESAAALVWVEAWPDEAPTLPPEPDAAGIVPDD